MDEPVELTADTPAEEVMTLEELRREVRRGWDIQNGLAKALRDLPEMPPPLVLAFLSRAAQFAADYPVGKRLQLESRDLDIPFNTECEMGAGLWFRLRRGLMDAKAD